MERNFKVGDKVWWITTAFKIEEGEVVDVRENRVICTFIGNPNNEHFYTDGTYYLKDTMPRLSLTPFTLELKGFTSPSFTTQYEKRLIYGY